MFYLQNVFMYMYIYEDITLTWTFSAKVLKKLWSSLKLKKKYIYILLRKYLIKSKTQ